MMSESDSQTPMWSYQVNLDRRVRDDHPVRRINRVLDLSFVRAAVAYTYGRRGNKSVPPVARLTRLEVKGGCYHVVNRGIEKQPIFRDMSNYVHFIGLLGAMPKRFGVRLHGYVLMP